MKQRIILLADDDADDRDMFCEALLDIDKQIDCKCVVNGNELMSKLNVLKEIPELIFLDLNMPVVNGWECLKLLKEDERYKNIPVIVISTSSHQHEIEIAAKLGALCYFVKPTNFKDLTKILKAIVENLGAGLKEILQHFQGDGSRYLFAGTNSDRGYMG